MRGKLMIQVGLTMTEEGNNIKTCRIVVRYYKREEKIDTCNPIANSKALLL